MRRSKLGVRRGRMAGSWAAACLVAATVATVVPASPAGAAAGDITTIAGGGSPADGLGDGGPATAASLRGPWGLERFGNRPYVSEEARNTVRRIVNGTITTFAGGGTPPLGDGLVAREATFNVPQGLAFDSAGNLYIADTDNNRVRRIDVVTRIVTTVAGTGTAGFSGDNGPATAAQLDHPLRVAVDAFGNVFISDNSHRIRRVDAVTHVITTVAGNGSSASTGDGGPARAAGFNPRGIAFDPAGNLYIADVASARIRKVVPGADHVVNGGPGETITTYVGGGTLLLGPPNEGRPATAFSLIDSSAFPEGVAFDGAGNLYVSLVASPRVIRVAAAGAHALTTVAGNGTFGAIGGEGDGGPATQAALNFPFGVTVDPAGNVFIADVDSSNSRIRRVDAGTHVITTVIGLGQRAMSAAFGTYGDGGPAAAAPVGEPADVAFRGGSLFLVDRATNLVRRIDANGVLTTYAGGAVVDGGAAAAAVLNHPRGLDTDAAGNLYIADCGNGRVRKVTPDGRMISTVAGGGDSLDTGPAISVAVGCPSDVAVVKSGPEAGTIYIADSADNRIRKVAPDGTISTVVGTGVAGFGGDGRPATSARLDDPRGVNLAPDGDLLIADTGNNRVRRVDVATGTITTVAGNGAFGLGAEGVQATTTPVVGPTDAIVDSAGNLVIAESGFNRIRMVTPAGIITTIAGNGIPGFSGDGGPARNATLNAPTQLELDATGNLLFTDRANGRVRRIANGTSPPPPATGCGAVITATTTLFADVGPCTGDGLVIGADNITLNLNGHTISGAGPGDGNNVGIRLTVRRGVRITGPAGSTVRGFSAGVGIIGGSGNRVSNLTLRDNVGPPTDQSNFGDGIGILFSANNTIIDNTITHNGVYDGIGVLGLHSDDNKILNNRISDTVDMGQISGGTGNGVIVNAFLGEDFPREQSLHRNSITGNLIETSDNAGVANLSNVDGVVADNVIRGNGRDPANIPRNGIGIRHLDRAQPDTHMLIQNNTVIDNDGGDGIQVGSEENTLRSNQVHGNDSGIVVTGQGHRNQILNNNAADNVPPAGQFGLGDLDDDNFNFEVFDYTCDQNTWRGNIWGSGGHFPDCTAIGGHPAPGGPPPPASGAKSAARMARGAPPPPAPVDNTVTRGHPAMP